MRFIISAIVSILRAGLGMEREVSSTWSVPEVPTHAQLADRIEALVNEMINNPRNYIRDQPLVYDTFTFEITGVWRVD
jgi:hypothetical protein